MARNRGAVLVVAAAMMNAMTAIYRGNVTWKYLSPVLSACQALTKAVMTARTYGGAVSRRDLTLPYFSLSTTVGKKLVTEADHLQDGLLARQMDGEYF